MPGCPEGGLVIHQDRLPWPNRRSGRNALPSLALDPADAGVGKAPLRAALFTFVGLERMIQAAGFELIETGTGPGNEPLHRGPQR